MTLTTSTNIIGVFKDRALAEQAIEALYDAGFPQDSIRYTATDSSGNFFQDLKSLFTGSNTNVDTLVRDLTHMGLPDDDVQYYANEYSHGHIILAVNTTEHAQEASTILQQSGAYNTKLSRPLNNTYADPELQNRYYNTKDVQNLQREHDVNQPAYTDDYTTQPKPNEHDQVTNDYTTQPNPHEHDQVTNDYTTQPNPHEYDQTANDYTAQPNPHEHDQVTNDYTTQPNPHEQAQATDNNTAQPAHNEREQGTDDYNSAGTYDYQGRIQSLQQQLQATRQQLEEAKARLQTAKEHESQIQSVRQQLQQLQDDLRSTQNELQETHKRIQQY